MDRRSFLLRSAVGSLALAGGGAFAAGATTLRFHQMVPRETSLTVEVIAPWTQRIEAASGGLLKIEIYPSMQLGGAPQALYDQVKDGVVDFSQAIVGYTPSRFPRTETFELPFLMTDATQTSVAFQRFVEAECMSEFEGVRLISVNTHGPGILHTKKPVTRLEDLRGMKIRGGSRIINDMLGRLGAEPIAMPVTQLPEALATGVIEGCAMPWDLTPQLRLAELVHYHTSFSGNRGLYTQAFVFAMNLGAYEALPDDVKAAIDAESGVEVARAMGQVTDEGDIVARKIAEDAGNTVIVLDEAETARWKDAVQPTIEQWYADTAAQGIDGRGLHEKAMALVEAESSA